MDSERNLGLDGKTGKIIGLGIQLQVWDEMNTKLYRVFSIFSCGIKTKNRDLQSSTGIWVNTYFSGNEQ